VRPDRTAFEREEFTKSLKTAWELKQKEKEAWVNYQGVVKVRDGGRIKTWADVADRDGAPALNGRGCCLGVREPWRADSCHADAIMELQRRCNGS
jgi:hypothetical protein